MKVGFLITGRLKSTRLKEKLVLKILDREVIAHMIDRIKLSPVIDEIIIATSTNPQDDPLEVIAKREEIKVFRGSEADVVERLYQAAIQYKLDYIINITADCPLVAYDFIPNLLDCYKNTNADLISCLNLPHGLFFYGIKCEALKRVIELKDTEDTEVWSAYFTDTGKFKTVEMDIPEKFIRPNYRLTLDYPEDFSFFEKLYQGYGPSIIAAKIGDIIDYLDHHPEIADTNKGAKEKYQKRWDAQNSVKLK